MAQKMVLEDRGAVPREDGDLLRGYRAVHEEKLSQQLCCWMMWKIKQKKGGKTRKRRKTKVEVGKEKWREKGKDSDCEIVEP